MSLKRLEAQDRLGKLPVPLLALTGGIASGKSSVSRLIRSAGHPLLCADELVKKIYTQKESLAFIQENFPSAVEEGKINFKKLGKLFFEDEKIQAQIEGFLYPRLEKLIGEEYLALGSPSYLFYDVPLLFEKAMDSRVDLKIVVYTSRETQISRLIKRNSLERAQAENILAHQWDIEKKKELCDFLINNEGPESDLPQLVQNLLQKLFA